MSDFLLLAAAAATVAVYVCRVDALSWVRTPWLMLLHLTGAVPSAWVLKVAALDITQPAHYAALAASIALLVVLYPRMPKPPPAEVPAPAPVQASALERVRGGSKQPEQMP